MKKDSNLNADKPEGNKSSIKNSRNENEEIQMKYRDKFEKYDFFEDNSSPIMLEGGKALQVKKNRKK